jgi:hypothetical protein
MLLAEIARDRGTSENVQRITHGLDGEDHAPVPTTTLTPRDAGGLSDAGGSTWL